MKNILTKIILIIFLFYGCGFKVVKLNSLMNDYSLEIKTSGETRINYKIKNGLSINSNDKEKLLLIEIDTKKLKETKERNIKNEINKYSLTIISNISFTADDLERPVLFTIKKSGEYKVEERHSATLNNEKKLIDTLTTVIVDEILNKISKKINDS